MRKSIKNFGNIASFVSLAFCASQAFSESWDSSFSKSEKGEEEEAPEDDEKEPPMISAETDLKTSFPSRLHFGVDKEPDWSKVPEEAEVPRKITKKLKVGKCAFQIETGAYVISTYGVSGIGEYSVETAALAEKTKLQLVPNEQVFLSVSAELNLKPLSVPKFCKKLFTKGRARRPLPALVLSGELAGFEDGKHIKASKVVREAQGDQLFVAWDATAKTIRLENQDGVKPMIESTVNKFQVGEETAFYLVYNPAWKMVRKQKTKE